MGVNVVKYGGRTVVDMTDATATPETVLAGYTAYGADGNLIAGTAASTGATLTVNAPAGAAVTVSKDGEEKTKVADSSGVAVFNGLTTGKWTVTITDGTETAVDTVQLVADYTKKMSFVQIHGIYRDIKASSPVWIREDDAVGKTATASVGTVAGSSDFDNHYPWSEIKRETFSTGDVMVKIPKFWFQRYQDGNIEHIRIANKPVNGFTLHPAFNHADVEKDCVYVGAYKTSDNSKSVTGASPQVSQTRGTMRTNAKSKGTGWGLIDIATVSAIQMLILVEFANNDVQSVIGRGYCDATSSEARINTGSCDAVSGLTGRPSGTDGLVDVVWRGIEGFWGNIWEWIDGVNWTGGKYYVCNDPSRYMNDTTYGYTELSYMGATDWAGYYITQEGLDAGNNPHVMLPSEGGSGSASTYQCDGCWSLTGWRGVRRGGHWYNGYSAGLFAVIMNTSSSFSDIYTGSRLQYIPQ